MLALDPTCRADEKKPGVCRDKGKEGHRDSAHRLPDALVNWATMATDSTLCRSPTTEEINALRVDANLPPHLLPRLLSTSERRKGDQVNSSGRGRGYAGLGEAGRGDGAGGGDSGRGRSCICGKGGGGFVAGDLNLQSADMIPPPPSVVVGAELAICGGHDDTNTAFVDMPKKRNLPCVVLPVEMATHRGLLVTPLRTLAARLAPRQMIIDRGGQGQSGPNSLAYVFGYLKIIEGDGVQLRLFALQHLRQPGVLGSLTPFKWRSISGGQLTLQELIVESMRAWPDEGAVGIRGMGNYRGTDRGMDRSSLCVVGIR